MLTVADLPAQALQNLLNSYSIQVETVANSVAIPGSFWGYSEAGLIMNKLYVRSKTPVHSALHEACHYICLDSARRNALHTDAGGDYDEENAVCYLQVLLADEIPGFGHQQMFSDMDAWGYTFRLGSARQWFEEDAEDAQAWLLSSGVISNARKPTFQLRKKA